MGTFGLFIRLNERKNNKNMITATLEMKIMAW